MPTFTIYAVLRATAQVDDDTVDTVAAGLRPYKRLPSGPAHLRLIIDHAVKVGYLGAPPIRAGRR